MGNGQQGTSFGECSGHYEPTLLGLVKNPFFQAELSSDVPVLSEFVCKSYYNDPYFKECKVLEHKSTHELIILKELSYESKAEMQRHFGEFKNRMEMMTSENIIRLRCKNTPTQSWTVSRRRGSSARTTRSSCSSTTCS